MTELPSKTSLEWSRQMEVLLQNGLLEDRENAGGEAFLLQFSEQGRKLCAAMIAFGNHHHQLLKQQSETPAQDVQRAYFVTYHWAGRAKGFLILWRDILLQLQKAELLLRLGETSAENIDWLCLESRKVLREAAEDLGQYLEERMRRARRSKAGIDRHLRRLQLQRNPWPVYEEQFSAMAGQMELLLDSFRQMDRTIRCFDHIRRALDTSLTNCENAITKQREIAGQTIASIEKNSEQKAGKIAGRLEEKEAEIQLPQYINEFTATIEETLAKLPDKLQVPIATEGGMIQYKETSFRRSTRQWLDAEIFPLLYEIWELTELNVNGLKMSLLNIRNRALLLAGDQKDGKNGDFDARDLTQPLLAFLRKSATTAEEFRKLQSLVYARTERDFRLSHLYQHTEHFLPVPLQSTINKLRVNRNVLVSRAEDWWTRQSAAFRRFRKNVEIEEALSVSEKVARYLQSRNWEATNTYYNSLFLTKGYIGESFWVGRTDELNHVRQLISDWRNGFRGAVVLTGRRLSGKSLLGEVVANRFFPQHTIRLQPQSGVNVLGRRLATSYNLEEALTFIRKHTLNEPFLVWIDDLELWQEPGNIPLAKNITALRRFIDDYSNQLFFVVTMGNSLRHHLERFFNIGKVFQAEINLDRMPAADVREAIMIRHGATHKELLDGKGREVSPQQFQQMTARVHRAAHGNIGEALNIWAFSTQAVDEDRVQHELKTLYELPDLLNPDNALLLTSILLSKKTNEYRLRKLFGPAFSEKYRGVLQRLISTGLLRREGDSWLEVTESAANDVGRLLERKQYLIF